MCLSLPFVLLIVSCFGVHTLKPLLTELGYPPTLVLCFYPEAVYVCVCMAPPIPFSYEVVWVESSMPFESHYDQNLDVDFFQHRVRRAVVTRLRNNYTNPAIGAESFEVPSSSLTTRFVLAIKNLPAYLPLFVFKSVHFHGVHRFRMSEQLPRVEEHNWRAQ
ncbi:unnamed protein product [Schistocephalus solidus]|uniref:Secreted protein n=1 Tax=Schistocephalus solidus TaxID=70667 RepID=A0A183TMK3_SCHSO|nr:unnamed protein product [Schistocephalus solidus]